MTSASFRIARYLFNTVLLVETCVLITFAGFGFVFATFLSINPTPSAGDWGKLMIATHSALQSPSWLPWFISGGSYFGSMGLPFYFIWVVLKAFGMIPRIYDWGDIASGFRSFMASMTRRKR